MRVICQKPHKPFRARSTDSHSFIFIHSLFHAFDNYTLDNFYVPGIVLDAGDEEVDDIVLPQQSVHRGKRRRGRRTECEARNHKENERVSTARCEEKQGRPPLSLDAPRKLPGGREV